MNLFRCTKDGSLDKEYLRTSAVYKLLKKKIINKQRAVELLEQRGVPKALAHLIQCAPKARTTSGGRFHPESCRLFR